MQSPTIYIFLNKGLHLSVGKASSQVAHAALMALIDSESMVWVAAPHRTIIILEGRDENHLRNIKDYLGDHGIDTHQVVDEGANEIDPHTITALATVIVDKDDEAVQKTLSTFKLYRDDIKVTLEIPR